MAKLKRLIVQSIGDAVLQTKELSYSAGGKAYGTVTLENSMVMSYKVKHTLRMQQSTSMCLSKRNENMFTPRFVLECS